MNGCPAVFVATLEFVHADVHFCARLFRIVDLISALIPDGREFTIRMFSIA
jgi:hypothetical protein